jgi:hypothetical protein
VGDPAQKEHVLRGFVGDKLTAFLGAIGALRLLSELADPPDWEARLSWTETHPYHPILDLGTAATIEELVGKLHQALARFRAALPLIDSYDTVPEIPHNVLMEKTQKACRHAEPGKRIGVDWLSSLAFEGGQKASKAKSEDAEDDDDAENDRVTKVLLPPRIVVFNNKNDGTAFVKNGRLLLEETTLEHLTASLFSVWDYDDFVKGRPSLRLGWDPNEVLNSISLGQVAKRIRWKPFEQGANALALVGFSVITAVPLLSDAGGSPGSLLVSRHGRDELVTWPLWSHPLTLDEVRSVLTRRELHLDAPPAWLRDTGIIQIVRAKIEGGKSRRVSPSTYAF